MSAAASPAKGFLSAACVSACESSFEGGAIVSVDRVGRFLTAEIVGFTKTVPVLRLFTYYFGGRIGGCLSMWG
jgi:hypothetical protein